MNRREVVLMAMAPACGETYTPVQIQKLLFLIDKKLPSSFGTPFFNFIPYDYGPFDKEVYAVLEELKTAGLVEILETSNLRWKEYRLTPGGQEEGKRLLDLLGADMADFINRLSSFVRSLSFADLVSAIYRFYPEMKENSVFRGC